MKAILRKTVLAGIFISVSAYAATNGTPDEECRIVDGPANLRATPRGEIRRSLPDLSSVKIQKREGEWYQVEGILPAGASSGARTTCWSQDWPADEQVQKGWLHRANFKELSWAKRLEVDRVGTLLYPGEKSRPHQSVWLNRECECAVYRNEYHDTPSISVRLLGARLLGTDCGSTEHTVTCTTQRAAGSDDVTCPRECARVEDTRKLTDRDRALRLRFRAEAELKEFAVKLPPKMRGALAEKYPGWYPLVMPLAKTGSDYEYVAGTVKGFGTFEFEEDGKKRPRAVLAFFETPTLAAERQPTLAYEGEKGIEFRRFPFAIRAEKGDEGLPFLCFGSGAWTGLVACRPQNEFDAFIGAFDPRVAKPVAVDEAALRKRIEPAPPEHGMCCFDLKRF